jgi:hypothetical protein
MHLSQRGEVDRQATAPTNTVGELKPGTRCSGDVLDASVNARGNQAAALFQTPGLRGPL